MASKARLCVLRRQADFEKIKKLGVRVYPSPWLIFNYLPNADLGLRCGWTIPKTVGPAVLRNRIKRWLRVYFLSQTKQHGRRGVDLNVIVKNYGKDFYRQLSYFQLERVLDRGWKEVRA